ncbi:PREDICTED: uncharacterized protein LOC109212246 [Nicotiana attenuata]|uniref:Uncharacterized protein n=1 Tax=Nicotiana attenuata TaxID=49451 RepID=A0A314KJA1_NICAT|nr:PREDICTED: uncharacterized protein LOC109212246 [Nicotiana attenuata]OIT28759.1 hypothetical protein A4A49_23001 [Nicotiana attenuata]
MKAGVYLFSFRRLNKKGVAGTVGSEVGSAGNHHHQLHDSLTQTLPPRPSSLRWRFKNLSSGLRWKSKRLYKLRYWIVDCLLFKIVSVFEAIFLVSTLAFFYLCCGCHI